MVVAHAVLGSELCKQITQMKIAQQRLLTDNCCLSTEFPYIFPAAALSLSCRKR